MIFFLRRISKTPKIPQWFLRIELKRLITKAGTGGYAPAFCRVFGWYFQKNLFNKLMLVYCECFCVCLMCIYMCVQVLPPFFLKFMQPFSPFFFSPFLSLSFLCFSLGSNCRIFKHIISNLSSFFHSFILKCLHIFPQLIDWILWYLYMESFLLESWKIKTKKMLILKTDF